MARPRARNKLEDAINAPRVLPAWGHFNKDATMTIFSILSYLFQALGFTRWATALWQKHEQKVKAQAVADAPKTDAEWTDAGKGGKL